MRSRLIPGLVGVGAVAAAVVAWKLLQPTPENVASRALDSLMSSDAATLVTLLRKSERDRCGITAESLQQLMTVMRTQELEYERKPWFSRREPKSATISAVVRGKGMSPTAIGFTAVETGTSEGIKCSELAAHLTLFASLLMRDPPTERKPTGIIFFRTLRDFLESHIGELEATGIKGVVVFRDDGERFFTWREYLEDRRALVRRFESKAR